ncbi:speckle-type POZ protein-like [Paramacrobiotus metropolitanus]|uniref:speckle-type POZ protein-like n=1 Tax=Paramacrobiotus metropolitanus TaxID=2943436 RepID=UPI002445DA79|nr:speckle-type POZ protein-like [Paramacrobiotus metropolitanus]
MTCRTVTQHSGVLYPIVLLYEIPTERFEKSSNGCGYWIYTADISVEEQPQHTGIPPTVWCITITVNQTNGVASAKIEPCIERTQLTSPETIRVECAVSGTVSAGYGDKFEVTIGPDGWASQETARSVSVPIDSDYYALCRTSHCRLRSRATVYASLAFYTQPDRGRTAAHQRQLLHSLGHLLDSGRSADCTVVSREGKEFPAHRALLAAQSPVFDAMFHAEMKERASGVCRVEESAEIVAALLRFAYTCCGTLEQGERMEELLEAADKYDMREWRAHCEDVMADGLNVENALRYLVFAKERGLKKLKVKAAQFIGENCVEI